MFKIGDTVVYPMHGLGVINSIEEKEFAGEKKEYYTINLLNNDMNIMISSEKITDSKLRLISDRSTLDKILSSLQDKKVHSSKEIPHKQRYQINMEKMKSGSLEEGIELIFNLTHRNNEKTLNTNEMQMLTTTRNCIINEIALIENITKEQAEGLLDANIN